MGEEAIRRLHPHNRVLAFSHTQTQKVEECVEPSSDTVNAINQWFSGHGIATTLISPDGNWVLISVPVSKANGLLDAQFNIYTDQESGRETVRTLAYSVPVHLASHVNLIDPTISYVAVSLDSDSNSESNVWH